MFRAFNFVSIYIHGERCLRLEISLSLSLFLNRSMNIYIYDLSSIKKFLCEANSKCKYKDCNSQLWPQTRTLHGPPLINISWHKSIGKFVSDFCQAENLNLFCSGSSSNDVFNCTQIDWAEFHRQECGIWNICHFTFGRRYVKCNWFLQALF